MYFKAGHGTKQNNNQKSYETLYQVSDNDDASLESKTPFWEIVPCIFKIWSLKLQQNHGCKNTLSRLHLGYRTMWNFVH